MSSSIREFLCALIAPAAPAYTTIIYPTRGMPVVVHDGLGIVQERPHYPVPVKEQEDALPDPFDIQAIDDEIEKRLSILGAHDAGYGFSDALDDMLVPSTIDFGEGLDEFSFEFVTPADTGSSIDSCHLFDSDIDCFTNRIEQFDVNPASGLPMMNDVIDVGGNIYGMD